jgi:6-phosphogluconate dehydrogenase
MQLGMIGLGRMGGNMVRRLIRGGHECVVYDRNAKAVEELGREGAKGAPDLGAFVKSLNKPRAVWIMLPAGEITEQTVATLAETKLPLGNRTFIGPE